MFAPRSESMAHELGKVTGSLFSSYVFLQSPSAVVKYYPFYINAYYIELFPIPYEYIYPETVPVH